MLLLPFLDFGSLLLLLQFPWVFSITSGFLCCCFDLNLKNNYVGGYELIRYRLFVNNFFKARFDMCEGFVVNDL